MKDKALRYGLGFVLTLLLFAFASWGDFSWVTLTGPISLEPDLDAREAAGYIASPALRAAIIRLLFLLVWIFCCLIPNLAGGLRRHARYWLPLAAGVYVFFSYLLGSFTFCASRAPGASTPRIAALGLFFILLVSGYDASRRTFKFPGFLPQAGFLVPLAVLAVAVGLAVSIIFQGPAWLFNGHIHFALLRLGVFLSALTGALAFYACKRNN